MPRLCVACALALALVYLLGLASPAGARAADPAPVSFIRDVAPVLQEQCFACHNARKKSGKYDMTRFDLLTAGGSNGGPITAGNVAESDFHGLMVANDEHRMPPRDKGDGVPAGKAALVARWIQEGAKLDPGIDPAADLVRELRARWVPPAPAAVYAHPPVVNALVFTPDGQALVVGGRHELTVWALPAGKLTRRIRTRAERAYAVLFLKDGTLAVAGGRPGQEGDVCVYDLAAPGKTDAGVTYLDGVADPKVKLATLVTTDDAVLCLATSPDQSRLAAGGCDRAARVWDISAGATKAKLTHTAETHTDWVLGVALSADNKWLATAGRDKAAKVFDLTANESALTFPAHNQPVHAVAFTPDGQGVVSVGADKELRAWSPTGEGKQTKAGHGHADEVFRLALHPASNTLATASADKTVRLWDATKLQPKRTLEGLPDHVYAVAFSPDGKLVAGGAYTGDVRVWAAADGKVVAAFVAAPGRE